MRRFSDDLDRMFEGFGSSPLSRLRPWSRGDVARFSPDVEMLERDGNLLVRADC
jgi:hypothetical protein